MIDKEATKFALDCMVELGRTSRNSEFKGTVATDEFGFNDFGETHSDLVQLYYKQQDKQHVGNYS